MTASNEAIRLTRAQVVALNPCSENHIPDFGRRKSMTASQALDAGTTIPNLLWVAGRLGRKDLCVRFALACAQRVAHLNPDARVQAALDATAAWLADPTDRNRAAAWASGVLARAAARAAAWAARAADAAEAADTAARAADAAARAARAAEDAEDAEDAEREAQRAIFKEIFG